MSPASEARERDRRRSDERDRERAELDREIDRAIHLATYLPPPIGQAIADLFEAMKPVVASDGHLSIACIGRHSPEMIALARAITVAVTASAEAGNDERAQS